jgi:hypothetical protein
MPSRRQFRALRAALTASVAVLTARPVASSRLAFNWRATAAASGMYSGE